MSDYLKPLDDWAETLAASGINITHQALLNARKLAEGKLDVVVVLIEPCNSHDMSYEEMFNSSSALQEVDRLVRACTGIYTILDITVLDMKPLISEKRRQDLATQGYKLDEDKGYKIIEEILLIKKSEIILTLQCATNDAKSPIAKSLCGPTPGTARPILIQLQDRKVLVFRGFHPSSYLRNDYAANRDDVQGRVYTFKSRSECLGLGMLTPDVPDIVRSYMVLVLNIVPGKLDYVKVMTITSTLKDDCDYVPISPAPKKGYAIQLRLRNCREGHHRDAARLIPILPKYSYLKIDSYYEVPIQMLVESTDCFGHPLMVWPKHQGGLGELRSFETMFNVVI